MVKRGSRQFCKRVSNFDVLVDEWGVQIQRNAIFAGVPMMVQH